MSKARPIELPQAFYEANLITGVLKVVQSGKEATVYCCQAHTSTGVEYLAARVYRPRELRSFQNDAVYQQGRVVQGTGTRGDIGVKIIDFPQAVDLYRNPSAFALLARDVENVCDYFARYGVPANPSRLARQLWSRARRGEI